MSNNYRGARKPGKADAGKFDPSPSQSILLQLKLDRLKFSVVIGGRTEDDDDLILMINKPNGDFMAIELTHRNEQELLSMLHMWQSVLGEAIPIARGRDDRARLGRLPNYRLNRKIPALFVAGELAREYRQDVSFALEDVPEVHWPPGCRPFRDTPDGSQAPEGTD